MDPMGAGRNVPVLNINGNLPHRRSLLPSMWVKNLQGISQEPGKLTFCAGSQCGVNTSLKSLDFGRYPWPCAPVISAIFQEIARGEPWCWSGSRSAPRRTQPWLVGDLATRWPLILPRRCQGNRCQIQLGESSGRSAQLAAIANPTNYKSDGLWSIYFYE